MHPNVYITSPTSYLHQLTIVRPWTEEGSRRTQAAEQWTVGWSAGEEECMQGLQLSSQVPSHPPIYHQGQDSQYGAFPSAN